MRGRNFDGRLERLEDALPRGYTTFGADGKPVIQSQLPTKEWFQWALNVFRSRRTAQKQALREQIEKSVGPDSGGGYLYQFVAAAFCISTEEKQ